MEIIKPQISQELKTALEVHLTRSVTDKQIKLFKDVLDNLPTQLISVDQFLKLTKLKQSNQFDGTPKNDGKDWARAIYLRVLAGEKPTGICVKWAKEVLEKLGEIEKVTV